MKALNDWKLVEGARTSEVRSGVGCNPIFCKLLLEEVIRKLFALRILRDGAKPARLINFINFSTPPSFPLSDFQVFSQSIFTKVSMYFPPSICETKQVQNNTERQNIVQFVWFLLETAVQEQLYIHIQSLRNVRYVRCSSYLGRQFFFITVNEYFNHKI